MKKETLPQCFGLGFIVLFIFFQNIKKKKLFVSCGLG